LTAQKLGYSPRQLSKYQQPLSRIVFFHIQEPHEFLLEENGGQGSAVCPKMPKAYR
jgi:hypothetical protein